MEKCVKLFSAIFISSMVILLSACVSVDKVKPVDNSFYSNNNHFSKSVFRDTGTVDSIWNNDDTFRTGMIYDNGELYYARNSSADSVKVLNTGGEERSIGYSGGEFTVYDGKLFFISDGKICYKELTSDNAVELTDGESFKLYGDFLLTENNKTDIYKISLSDNKKEKVCSVNNQILWYSVDKDKLYIIYNDVDLQLVTVDLLSNELLSQYSLNINPANFVGVICSDNLIIGTGNSIYFLDLSSGQQVNALNCDGIIAVNGEADKLYFSVCRTYKDGSVTRIKESADNGLWCYDFTTAKQQKISDNIFDRLYVCSNDCLFAAKNSRVDYGVFSEKSSRAEIYQINLNTREQSRVA